METLMIKSRSSLKHFFHTLNASTLSPPDERAEGPRALSPGREAGAPAEPLPGGTAPPSPANSTMGHNHSLPTATPTLKTTDEVFTTRETTNFTYSDNTTDDYFPNYWANSDDLSWNGSYLNNTNVTGYNVSDYELSNTNSSSVQYGFWFCAKWVDAQQDLFQAANLCLAAAFLVPKSFKQSILLFRALAAAGFLLLAIWAATELCAPDVLAWNVTLVIINSIHTVLLIIRFLPPALSLELTELYLRQFKPLKVSKKHFKELAREARIMRLSPGEPYAVEGVTPADERLSILLKGKMKVSCEQTHLHMIHPHQFVDSPEWEANHEQSDDVYQVTIVADEGCTYLCWPRMRLERVLRHRPLLKIVLDSIIGKDITHKLYSLNEQQLLAASETAHSSQLCRPLPRSVSADAVDVGSRGRMRSLGWRTRERRSGNIDKYSPLISQPQPQWMPVASQFPQQSPFAVRRPVLPSRPPFAAQSSSSSLPFPSPTAPLLSPPKKTFRKTASFRKNREVKFVEPHEAGL